MGKQKDVPKDVPKEVAAPERQSLLKDIQKGTKLSHADTNDRSGPQLKK